MALDRKGVESEMPVVFTIAGISSGFSARPFGNVYR
jgi:hypothetical protein